MLLLVADEGCCGVLQTLWALNITAPKDILISVLTASSPLMESAPQGSSSRGDSGRVDHLYKATAAGVPSITLSLP